MHGQSAATQQRGAEARRGAGEAQERLRHQVATSLLRVGAVSSSPVFAYLCYRAWIGGAVWLVASYTLAFAALALAAFWRKASYRTRGGALLVVACGLALVALFREGRAGQGQVFLVAGTALATLLLGRRVGLASLLASVVLLTSVGWLRVSGIRGAAGGISRSAWVADTLVLVVVGGALIFAVSQLVEGLAAAVVEMEHRTSQLESRGDALRRETEGLERRNLLLSGRSEALGKAVGVAIDMPIELGEDALLDRAAELASERFGFSHVGIFALDPTGEWAELRAASGEGGKRMLARRHRLRVGQEGLIGFVTDRGEARVTPDVAADALYYENPDLPETKSELAVPLRYQGRTIGALDIQETSPDAFGDEDIVAIQALADLVADALGSARRFEQLQHSVAVERRSYARLSAQAWLERARAAEDIGYRYDQGTVSELIGPRAAVNRDARDGASTCDENTWPLRVRGRLVGSVEAHKHAERGEWSLAERELMEAVIEQLGAALESARLYEDAQFRAAGDRLVADVTGRIRETLDLDTVLRTVADEIYAALELEEVVVHLVSPEPGDGLSGER